jgi:hypothetical protein
VSGQPGPEDDRVNHDEKTAERAEKDLARAFAEPEGGGQDEGDDDGAASHRERRQHGAIEALR